RRILQHRENFLDLVGHQQVEIEIATDEFESLHVIDQRAKRIPEVLDICKQDWLAMTAKLNPCHLFDNFFERSDTTGHGHEGIRHFEHFALSFVHVARDNEIVGTAHRMLTRDQEFGNNAGHLSAMLTDRFGNGSHHSDRAAAEDEADAVFGEKSAEGAAALDE